MCTSPWKNLGTELCTTHEDQESFLSLSQRENCLSSFIQDAVGNLSVFIFNVYLERLFEPTQIKLPLAP